MSRRMLLEDNYSENDLMPVMNGLICWLDGRDYDGTNSVKDRINKKMFTCNNIINKKNVFVYDKSDSTIFTEFNNNEDMYNLFNRDFTLCFTDKLDKRINYAGSISYPSSYPRLLHINNYSGNSPYQLSYFSEGSKANMMRLQGFDNTNNDIFKKNDICNSLSKKSIVIVKTGNIASAYLNERKYDTVSDYKNNILNLERLTLGNNYLANRAYYGNICSFKAYNRALTEEEIQQNYLYEQSIERGE